MLELYHTPMSVCSVKVRLALAEKAIEDWKSHIIDLRENEQKTPEFLALNPKGLVPVLVHDGQVVTESNIIMEYIEDAFPETVQLVPAAALGRARMRGWMQRLDTGLHLHIAQISIGIVQSAKFLADNDTPEKRQAFIDAIRDPVMRKVYEEAATYGISSPSFDQAIKTWRAALSYMDVTLKSSPYFAGDAVSLADFAYVSYVHRLQFLQMDELFDGLPRVAVWYERMKETKGYKDGLEKWSGGTYAVPQNVIDLGKVAASKALASV